MDAVDWAPAGPAGLVDTSGGAAGRRAGSGPVDRFARFFRIFEPCATDYESRPGKGGPGMAARTWRENLPVFPGLELPQHQLAYSRQRERRRRRRAAVVSH